MFLLVKTSNNGSRMNFLCVLNSFYIDIINQGREEQAEPDGTEEVTKAAKLMGIDHDYLVDTFMKPKLKVGKDYVKKGQNKDQVRWNDGVDFLAQFVYYTCHLFDDIQAKMLSLIIL